MFWEVFVCPCCMSLPVSVTQYLLNGLTYQYENLELENLDKFLDEFKNGHAGSRL